MKIDRNSKKKHYPILIGNPSFRYHLARENYLPVPIATFLFASDIPQKELPGSIDKGPSGLGKEIRKTYALMQNTLKSQQT